MKYYNRDGKLVENKDYLNEVLKKAYSSNVGTKFIRSMTHPSITKASGKILNSKLSKLLIIPFLNMSNIDMNEYEDKEYTSYNDFFTRKIKPHARNFSDKQSDLCAPCDGKLSVFRIDNNCEINIKNSIYSLESLLKNKALAKRFELGYVAVFRLSVDNYHRYSYIDSGDKSRNISIPGRFYSVDPAVLEKVKVFKENQREYCVIKTENFGTIIQMEVGATMVGKIHNFHEEKKVKRGEEKGYFEFGGSTIVLIFEKNTVEFYEKYINPTYEHQVNMGDVIGVGVDKK